MTDLTELLPPHIRALVEKEGDYVLQARYIDCVALAALFHNNQLPLGNDVAANHQAALEFLFDPGEFEECEGRLTPESVNVYFEAHNKFRWRQHPELVVHTSVNLGSSYVLNKNGTGASRCQVVTIDEEIRDWNRFGKGMDTALLVRRKK